MSLEGMIKSERYEFTEVLGRGCWGIVYAAHDKLLDEDVAIKVLAPSDLAVKQMEHRNLTLMDAMKKEAGKLAACGNIVPRRFELDDNNTPFIVMPRYAHFLSERLDGPKIKLESGNFGGEKFYKSNLSINNIIRFSKDIISGLAEIHNVYNRAHCDLKPDNLAVDKDGKVLISDMGTSTFAASPNPRDNMGCQLTRSPRLFFEGISPQKSADIFAFGSLLYKMFTDEYIFEPELKSGDPKAFMEKLVNKFGDHVSFNRNYYELIERKVESADIPAEFKSIIGACLKENYHDADQLKWSFEIAVKNFEESRIKKTAFDEFKAKTRNNLLGAFGCGTVIAGLLLGGSWLTYLGKRPDFSNRPDIETKLDTRTIEKSEIVLEVERKYGKEFEIVGNEIVSPYLEEHLVDTYGDKTLVDKITRAWLNSIEDTGAKLLPDEFFMRFNRIRPFTNRDQPIQNYADEIIRAMVTHYLGACQVSDNVIDLEDALTVTRVGRDTLYRAQKLSGSTEFNKYISVKDANGSYAIPYADQIFLKRWLYRVTQAVPQIVRLAPGSSQSEQDGKSPEDKK